MKNKNKILLGLCIASLLGGGYCAYKAYQNEKSSAPEEIKIPEKFRQLYSDSLQELFLAQKEIYSILETLPNHPDMKDIDLDKYDAVIAEGTKEKLLRLSFISGENIQKFQLAGPVRVDDSLLYKKIHLEKTGKCKVLIKDKVTLYGNFLKTKQDDFYVVQGQDLYHFFEKRSVQSGENELHVVHNGIENAYPISSSKKRSDLISKKMDELYKTL